MARKFIAASSQFLELRANVLTAMPFTMACWVKPIDVTTEYTLMFWGTFSTGSDKFKLVMNLSGNGFINAIARASQESAANTTTGAVAGQWSHACGVFTSATSRDAYLNGGSKGSNTTNRNPSGMDSTALGCQYTSGSGRINFFHGAMAEVGIWNAALNDGEVKSLALGKKPNEIRPMSLKAYWPLRRKFAPEIDVMHSGTNLLAVTGALSVPYNPPEVFYPRRKRYFIPPVVVVRPPGSTLILNAVHRAASW